MLALSAVTHIYLYRSACDMRRSFDGLCGLIRSELRADPLSGSLFVFCNRRRTMVKILYFEGDGLAIWMKRLERGRFSLPQRAALDGRIDRRQLMLLLEGVTPKKVSKRYVYQR
ncbi:transposase [uncultured Desulfatiglans sp.]|uniref:Transposase n=1 Tax=Uncultured Desulfatiglans sp. TaxID=1748965 RepID=A0A653AAD1_UNCDX|nr:transposase [uncultured Desulfatiglans sp.]VBB44888.1 transposase [uncultured Desulfatiglans sp.]